MAAGWSGSNLGACRKIINGYFPCSVTAKWVTHGNFTIARAIARDLRRENRCVQCIRLGNGQCFIKGFRTGGIIFIAQFHTVIGRC